MPGTLLTQERVPGVTVQKDTTMRTHYIILLLLGLFTVSTTASAQAQRDTLPHANNRSTMTNQKAIGAKEAMRKRNRGMDRFIDSDSDGICDHRAQGFGFRRCMADSGMKMRTHGQGLKK
jgi:hypothetical protein